MTGHLSPAVCGPYLRILRLPGATHPPQCQAKVDCKEEEECMVRPQGNECITPQHFMEEEFAIGILIVCYSTLSSHAISRKVLCIR